MRYREKARQVRMVADDLNLDADPRELEFSLISVVTLGDQIFFNLRSELAQDGEVPEHCVQVCDMSIEAKTSEYIDDEECIVLLSPRSPVTSS